MSRIKTTEDLYQAMRLDGIESIEALENAYAEIADALINDFVIQKGENGKLFYHFVELEFYHNIIDNTIVYPREADALQYFFHKSGVDLTFLSNNKKYGGILVRAIRNGDKFTNGPYNVVDKLFDVFDARELPKNNYPLIVPKNEMNRVTPVQSWRFHIDSDKKYRFSIPKEMWTDHKGYQAYPWDYLGNLKKK